MLKVVCMYECYTFGKYSKITVKEFSKALHYAAFEFSVDHCRINDGCETPGEINQHDRHVVSCRWEALENVTVHVWESRLLLMKPDCMITMKQLMMKYLPTMKLKYMGVKMVCKSQSAATWVSWRLKIYEIFPPHGQSQCGVKRQIVAKKEEQLIWRLQSAVFDGKCGLFFQHFLNN
ncbi:hypothetical protein T12_5927 [Trichinella patagoniensis]|uniref:Uncharacterized protein n=1 Tax=Trichinella patagoniensis TaxID=990121 RepID=A0A0V0ZJN4_9BILA|nr:hypothetical protein T12_5927 [Trichinella patagoniensis]